MQPYDEGIRRSIHETRIESLRGTMIAASYAAGRPHALRAKLGLRLIAAGERLACREALAARASV